MKPESKHPNLAAVILAAGFSSRMQRWKPGVILDGVPLIVRSILPALDVVSQLIVVGGYQFEELKRIVSESILLPAAQRDKISVVENADFSGGMFSSVQVGLSSVGPDQEAAFILPGDMPEVDRETYVSLAHALAAAREADVLIPVVASASGRVNGDARLKKGHPILLRKRVFPLLLREDRTAVLRDALKHFRSETLLVSDPGICIDIDDENDVAQLALHTVRHQQNGPTP